MTSEATDSHTDVQRLCQLAGLPRATYYRHLSRRSRETAECELRDQLQRICLKHPFYGYRRVAATLRRQGMVVNAKKVLRLMCQSAFKFDPSSASNFDPFARRGLTVALVSSELAGIVETRRARVA
jgi:putative transposase